MSNSPSARNTTLDLIRGISAILVCLGHLRNAVFVDFGHLPESGVAVRAFYFLTGLGHQAVIVFFVLSGFLVGGSVVRLADRFRWREYLIARLVRLWMVLLPALALTFLADRIVQACAPELLGGEMFAMCHSGPKAGEFDDGPLALLGNMFFLQGIAVSVYGINGPLWSLANEFWYYALFPLMAIAGGFAGNAGLTERLGLALAAVGVLWALPVEMRDGYVIWLSGACACAIAHRIGGARSWLRRGCTALTLAIFLGALVYAKAGSSSLEPVVSPDLAVGLACAIFCALTGGAHGHAVTPSRLVRAVGHVADMSYSLYLTHFPLLTLIIAALVGRDRGFPDAHTVAVFVVISAMLFAFAWGFWWLFEQRTSTGRAWIRSILNPVACLARGEIRNG